MILRSFIVILLAQVGTFGFAGELENAVRPLLSDSCVGCHDGSDSKLDLQRIGFDLTNEKSFRDLEHVYDRVISGEMPPASEERPNANLVRKAMTTLRTELRRQSRSLQQQNGRVILRRLTRNEYNYTLQDMLGITVDVTEKIPEENSTGFDTVFSTQGFSPLHVEGFLAAADMALNETIQLGRSPKTAKQRFQYKEQEGVRKNIDKNDGRVIVGETDDAIIMYSDASYIYKIHGLQIPHAGLYRIKARAYGHQTKKPVVLTLNAGNYKRGQTRVLEFFDLQPDRPQTVEVVAKLNRNEYLFPAPKDIDVQENGKTIWNIGPEKYSGSGVAIQWIEVEGPLVGSWPPQRTHDFLGDAKLNELKHHRWNGSYHEQFEVVVGDEPRKTLKSIVDRLAERAFRRPLKPNETDVFLKPAFAALESERSFRDGIGIACRNVLNSPEFLFFTGQPGELSDHDLAKRLSYFLWKSRPDDELSETAANGQLRQPGVLRKQVERMLKDKKAQRFINDFSDQWLRLTEIDATSPDKKLYPEFDELLKISMLDETHSFIRQCIENDLSTDNLIDSDFAMLNRRLAEHYGVDGVQGQRIQRISLPNNSPRGGVLTHASVLKITANGTVTSPVSRGSWVLTHLLGQPPSPPPADIGTVEPDTRGTTTIRETLAKHRNVDSCAVCHRLIDPPGFAMECFDVIGGFRDRYRSVGEGKTPDKKLHGRPIWEYKNGPRVDSSGKTSAGSSFANIVEFKKLLMKQKRQVAQNVVEQLIVYSTGCEIQFADREVVESIVRKCTPKFGLRTIIHEVVQSRLFREK